MSPLKLAAAAVAFSGVVSAQAFIGSFPLVTTNALPVGLEHDGAGNLRFTDIGANDEIGVCDTNGTILSTVSVLANTGNPIGITQDLAGNIYVTDTTTAEVDVYDLAGTYLSSFAVGAFTTFPEGITFNPVTGNLYVVDGTGGNQVFEFTTAGTNVAAFPLNGTSIDGIAHDISSNTYWVYDSGTDSLRNYDASFVELSSVPGTGANGIGAGEGVAVIGSNVYVCATGAGTVGVFSSSATRGTAAAYGQGCPAPSDFYELFATGGNDLSATSFTITPGAQGFTVTPTGSFDPNFASNLGSGDDSLFTANPLGFTATYPGLGQISAIDIDSNGRIGVGLPGSDFTESVGEFLGGNGAMVAVCWDDFNPSAGGGVYFDTDPNGTFAMVTWDQVPQFGGSDSNTFQVKLYIDGRIECNYVSVLDDSLVGLSGGTGAADPGSIDLTASMPFARAGGGAPLTLAATTRPVIGTSFDILTSNIPGTAVAGGTILGLAQVNISLPGLPAGCAILSSGEAGTLPLNLGTGALSIPVPNNTAIVGAQLFFQSAVIDTAQGSAIPVITSNGLAVTVGDA